MVLERRPCREVENDDLVGAGVKEPCSNLAVEGRIQTAGALWQSLGAKTGVFMGNGRRETPSVGGHENLLLSANICDIIMVLCPFCQIDQPGVLTEISRYCDK